MYDIERFETEPIEKRSPEWELRDVFRDQTDISEGRTERVGNPEALAEYWQEQPTDWDCGVTSQETALKALGAETSTEEIRQIGREMDPPAYFDGDPSGRLNGTRLDSLGYAFGAYGVGRETFVGQDRTEAQAWLRDHLAENKAVIVGVDAKVLCGQTPGGPKGYGDHAIWVTGADIRPDGSLETVYTNDSGFERGRQYAYPGDDFVNAWERSYFTAVSSERQFQYQK